MIFREYNTSTIHIDSVLQDQQQQSRHGQESSSALLPATPSSIAAPSTGGSSSSSSSARQRYPTTTTSTIHQEYHLLPRQQISNGGNRNNHKNDDTANHHLEDSSTSTVLIWSTPKHCTSAAISPRNESSTAAMASTIPIGGSRSSSTAVSEFIYLKVTNVASKTKQVCRDLFLPVGYPHTVAQGYLEYQFYDSLQGLCSYLRGVVSTSAVLTAAGVGDAEATAMSAAMTWAIRDGLGMIGGLLFSYLASPYFDAHVKEFRLLADVLNDVGLTLDMALPVILTQPWWVPFSSWQSTLSSYIPSLPLPSTYLIITSISTLCKVACGISAGATKGNITDHFTICGNRADVNAKESTQETLVSLVGMIVGVGLARWMQKMEKAGADSGDGMSCASDVGDGGNESLDTCGNNSMTDTQIISWSIFIILTIVHVWANYVGVQRLRLRTLNRERSQVALQPLVEDCGRWVLKECDSVDACHNADGDGSKCGDDKLSKAARAKTIVTEINIQKLLSPTHVSESLWHSICGMINPGNIHLGIRLRDLVRYCSVNSSSRGATCKWSQEHWDFMYNIFKCENYMILVDGIYDENSHNKVNRYKKENFFVIMRMGANSRDELKAFFHVHLLRWSIEHSFSNNEKRDASGAYTKQLILRSHEIVQYLFRHHEHCKGDGIDLYNSLSINGWDVTRLYLGFTPWRCEWESDDKCE